MAAEPISATALVLIAVKAVMDYVDTHKQKKNGGDNNRLLHEIKEQGVKTNAILTTMALRVTPPVYPERPSLYDPPRDASS